MALDDIHVNRHGWIEALLADENQDKQITQTFFDETGGYCVLGLGLHVLGFGDQDFQGHAWRRDPYRTAYKLFGIDRRLGREIADRSDRGATFREIGEWLQKELYRLH